MTQKKIIIPVDDEKFDERTCGVVQGISHPSIIELLKSTGYVRKNAVVRGLKIDEHSMQIYID